MDTTQQIAQQINHSGLMGDYVTGMWVDWLMTSLLWWSDHHSSSIQGAQGSLHFRKTRPTAPTWSWLSVEGPISTWVGNSRSVVTLIGLKYTLVREDPYGAYEEVRIDLHGQLTSINIYAVGDLPVSKYEIRQSDDGEPTELMPDTNPIVIAFDTLPKGNFYALKYSMCEFDLGIA
jgi:hypothetical protein